MTDLSTVLTRKEQLTLFGLPMSVNDAIVEKTRGQWLDKKRIANNNSDYGTFKDNLRAPIHR